MVSAGRINLYLYENRRAASSELRAACEAVPDADADAAQASASLSTTRLRRFVRRCLLSLIVVRLPAVDGGVAVTIAVAVSVARRTANVN